jgi:hypothetical protein
MKHVSYPLRCGLLLAIVVCASACASAPESGSSGDTLDVPDSGPGLDAAGTGRDGALFADDASGSDSAIAIDAPVPDSATTDARVDGATKDAAGSPDAGADAPGPPPPTCGCYSGNGAYCDSAAQAYASQHGCVLGTPTSSNDLLSCSNGAWSVQQQCPNGCTVESSGTPDQCTPSTNCSGLGLSGFISKFTGVCTGYPGWSPSNQCTDLCLQWVANVCLPVQFSGNAINWAGESVKGFTWVPNAPNSVPSPGDIVVFGPSSTDGVGSAGHVDICVSANVSSSTWQGFDQNWTTNWNGSCYPPQLVTHNWNENVLGWQHLTVPIP